MPTHTTKGESERCQTIAARSSDVRGLVGTLSMQLGSEPDDQPNIAQSQVMYFKGGNSEHSQTRASLVILF